MGSNMRNGMLVADGIQCRERQVTDRQGHPPTPASQLLCVPGPILVGREAHPDAYQESLAGKALSGSGWPRRREPHY